MTYGTHQVLISDALMQKAFTETKQIIITLILNYLCVLCF
jgi:hypothetical protein